jgi:hypothetical protein
MTIDWLNLEHLRPEHLRDLHVNAHQHPRGQAHLSAASALVQVGSHLYVVADDELHLGRLDAIDSNDPSSRDHPPVELTRLFEGDLPKDKAKRKKVKPDLETLAVLPSLPGCPYGALLALGSGSKPARHTGVLIALDAHAGVTERIAHIDLTDLYAPLRKRFPDLNIEGAFVSSAELRLLQRGNKGDGRNACIRYDWNLVAPWLSGKASAPPSPKSIFEIELGDVDGVPLGLTDGASLADGAWAFSAVAENTANSFLDGACAGSAVGIVSANGQLRALWRLQGAPKVEGIAVAPPTSATGDETVINLVTDADDPTIASQLLRVRLPTVA